jgi:hypothetical protein
MFILSVNGAKLIFGIPLSEKCFRVLKLNKIEELGNSENQFLRST